MVEDKFERSSVDIEEVVNNNVNTFHEDNVQYSIRARHLVGFELANGITDLLSREVTKSRDRQRVDEVWWDRGSGWGRGKEGVSEESCFVCVGHGQGRDTSRDTGA